MSTVRRYLIALVQFSAGSPCRRRRPLTPCRPSIASRRTATANYTVTEQRVLGRPRYVGDYGGFRIFDISKPEPTLVKDVRCYGPQADPSVFDTDRDGEADTLVLSVDSVLAGPNCGAGPVSKNVSDGQGGFRYPDGAWEGLRVFDISDPTAPQQIAAVYQDCGSHTNTLLPAPSGRSMYVLNSSYPLGEGPTCGPLGEKQGRKVNHGVVQVIEVPFSDPAGARELTELPIVYPGDADGVYKPVTDHAVGPPGSVLDNFLACHDLSSFPAKGIVGAACGEQAQVWEIDRRTGLPDTQDPLWSYDQPNVDFWHSATFSWDGKIANFIDESFGDGCPTTTTKTGGLPGGPREFQSGNMFFFKTRSGRSPVGVPQPAPDERRRSAPAARLTYCSSHLGIPVPARDRYLLVNAFYRGGSSVIDFTDPTRPREVAFGDLDGHEHLVGVHLSAQVGPPEHAAGVLERRAEPQLRGDRAARGLPGERRTASCASRRACGRTSSASTA